MNRLRNHLADLLDLAADTLRWLADRTEARHEMTAAILRGEDVE